MMILVFFRISIVVLIFQKDYAETPDTTDILLAFHEKVIINLGITI